MESEEVIKFSVENLIPIPSEFKGIFDDTCDVLIIRHLFSSEVRPMNGHIAHNFQGIVEVSLRMMILQSDDDDVRMNFKFLIDIEPDQEGLISIDNSNNTLLELPEFESFHFDPSFPRPPPEPPDVEICLYFEPDAPVINNFDVLNNDEPFDPGEGENVVFLNVEEDDSFTFTIRTFLPFLTYPEVSPLSCSTGSEDTIFDPGIFT
ncbi:hypothetical protein Tco_0261189 [Tanacetum coccineum]